MRLFVAVNLPPAEQNRIRQAAAPLRRLSGVRWTNSDSLHITLKFLGSVEETRVPAIIAALCGAGGEARPFDLALRGFGAFPDLRRPRIFWVGATGPGILKLQSVVEEWIGPLGFPGEARPFHPHVTIGRANREMARAEAAEVARAADRFDYEARLSVRTVELMQSHPVPGGVRYTAVASADLGCGED